MKGSTIIIIALCITFTVLVNINFPGFPSFLCNIVLFIVYLFTILLFDLHSGKEITRDMIKSAKTIDEYNELRYERTWQKLDVFFQFDILYRKLKKYLDDKFSV